MFEPKNRLMYYNSLFQYFKSRLWVLFLDVSLKITSPQWEAAVIPMTYVIDRMFLKIMLPDVTWILVKKFEIPIYLHFQSGKQIITIHLQYTIPFLKYNWLTWQVKDFDKSAQSLLLFCNERKWLDYVLVIIDIIPLLLCYLPMFTFTRRQNWA